MLHWPLSVKNFLQFSPEEIDGFIMNRRPPFGPLLLPSVLRFNEVNGSESFKKETH